MRHPGHPTTTDRREKLHSKSASNSFKSAFSLLTNEVLLGPIEAKDVPAPFPAVLGEHRRDRLKQGNDAVSPDGVLLRVCN